jgi:hypothetical protein
VNRSPFGGAEGRGEGGPGGRESKRQWNGCAGREGEREKAKRGSLLRMTDKTSCFHTWNQACSGLAAEREGTVTCDPSDLVVD